MSLQAFARSVFLVLFVACVSSCSSGGGSGGPSAVSSTDPPESTFPVVLAWDAPTQNEDGSDLDDLAGYRVYDRTAPGPYTMVTDVGSTTEFTMNLPAGDYHFAVTAYDRSGNESDFSNEIPVTLPLP